MPEPPKVILLAGGSSAVTISAPLAESSFLEVSLLNPKSGN